MGAGVAGTDGVVAAAAVVGAGAEADGVKFNTSSAVTRPPGPVPFTNYTGRVGWG